MCASEDCTWAGPVSSVGSKRLMSDVLINGFSPFYERVTLDNVHASTIKRMMDDAAKTKGSEITLENTIEADKMGSINVYSPNDGVDMGCMSCKLHILKTLQNTFLYFKDLKFAAERTNPTTPFDKFHSDKTGEKSAFYEEYGFPPIEIELDFDGKGIKSANWKFSRDIKIWQPIDWGSIELSKDCHIHYLAVLQVDGQNFTYFAYEDLHTGDWKAGISTREYGSMDCSIKFSSAKTVEEAAARLIKHYDTTYNQLIQDGDPVEVAWSKEFGYEHGLWSICCSVVSSDIFKDDCVNEALSLLNEPRREMYQNTYEQSFEQV